MSPSPSRSSSRKRNADIHDPIYKLPFEYDWRRVLVYRKRSSTTNKPKTSSIIGDVYYYSPDNKRFRSKREVDNYLKSSSNENSLRVENFTFSPKLTGHSTTLETSRLSNGMHMATVGSEFDGHTIQSQEMEEDDTIEDYQHQTVQAPENINLMVDGQDDTIIRFKMKKQRGLQKLMNSYCEHYGLDLATIRFEFDGHAIVGSDTPQSLEMEEGDTINVYQQQTVV